MVAEVVTLDRGLEPPRKPNRAVERAKRRRAYFVIRIGRAKTPDDKLVAAIDYLRATAKDHAVDQGLTETTLEHLTRVFIDAADALTKSIRRHR